MENYFGKDKANQAIERMDELLVTMLLLLEPSLLIYVTNLTAGKQSFRYALCAIVWNEVIVEPQYWNCLYWKAQNLSGQTTLLHVLLLNQS